MGYFRRFRGRYLAFFNDVEVFLLGRLVDQLRGRLAERRSGVDDPLVELTGIAAAPPDAPDDPVLARLLPDFARDDARAASGLRQLHEPALIAAKDRAATILLDTLPPGGGTISLTTEQAEAWAAALTDVRLGIGVMLDLKTDDQVLELPEVVDSATEVRAGMITAYHWLTAMQDSLVQQLLR